MSVTPGGLSSKVRLLFVVVMALPGLGALGWRVTSLPSLPLSWPTEKLFGNRSLGMLGLGLLGSVSLRMSKPVGPSKRPISDFVLKLPRCAKRLVRVVWVWVLVLRVTCALAVMVIPVALPVAPPAVPPAARPSMPRPNRLRQRKSKKMAKNMVKDMRVKGWCKGSIGDLLQAFDIQSLEPLEARGAHRDICTPVQRWP